LQPPLDPEHHSPMQMQPSALFLLVLASLAVVVTMQDSNPFTSVDCQSSGSGTPSPAPSSSSSSNLNNSAFWSNVVALLDALPSAAAPSRFASISSGNGTTRAFVRGICRGDTLPADCAKYLQNATLTIQSRCNRSSRRAGIWYDKCFVSYADTNASTSQEQSFRSILYNTGEVGDKDAFETTYYALMRQLTARVVNGSGTATSPSSSSSSLRSVSPMFATGEAVYDAAAPNGTMYGLLQCMRDRTQAECEQCLKDSVGRLPSCCYGHQGGVVLGYNCNLRVEIYTYYDLAIDAPPPSGSGFIGQSQGERLDCMVHACAQTLHYPIF
jgi:hypothetical protein